MYLVLLSLFITQGFCQLNILPISLQNQVGNGGQTTGVVNAPGLSGGRYPGLGSLGMSAYPGMSGLGSLGNPLLSGYGLGASGYPGLGMSGLGSFGNPLLSGYPGMGMTTYPGLGASSFGSFGNPLLSGYPGMSGIGMTGYPGLSGFMYPGMGSLYGSGLGSSLYPGLTGMYPGAMSPATSSLSVVSAPGVFSEINVNACAQGCPSGTYCSSYNGLAHCIPIGGGVGTIF